MINICHNCKKEVKVKEGDISLGYGVNQDGEKICFLCCAKLDNLHMDSEGDFVGYFTQNKDQNYEFTNWPGTLRFTCFGVTEYKQRGFGGNYACHSFRFRDKQGDIWSGRRRGDQDLARAKRLKLYFWDVRFKGLQLRIEAQDNLSAITRAYEVWDILEVVKWPYPYDKSVKARKVKVEK